MGYLFLFTIFFLFFPIAINEFEETAFLQYIIRINFIRKNTNIARRIKNGYVVYNKNVMVKYNKQSGTILCCDLKNHNELLAMYHLKYDLNNLSFIEIFDRILYSFNYETNFSNIQSYIDANNIYYEIYNDKQENVKIIEHTDEPVKKININQANEKEVAQLPGISIINAKKLIRYRDLHGGFKTTDEFFNQIKLRSHFKAKIEKMIEIGDYHLKNEDTNIQEGRFVDF